MAYLVTITFEGNDWNEESVWEDTEKAIDAGEDWWSYFVYLPEEDGSDEEIEAVRDAVTSLLGRDGLEGHYTVVAVDVEWHEGD
jgi:pyruvate-formate lyase-activating enzyme